MAQANHFLRTEMDPNTLQGVRSGGDIVKFNPVTNEFGITRADGVIRTDYRPTPGIGHQFPTNLDYFNDQF